MHHQDSAPIFPPNPVHLIIAVLCCLAWLDGADLKSELATLVRSELAFARASAEKGTREAFLEFLADDAVVFRPGPVDGKNFYLQSPPSKGTLSWYPEIADIARTADLGFTSGPYAYSGAKPSDPVQHGNYVSLWRKQADGAWKVILDTGVANPQPATKPPSWQPPSQLKFLKPKPGRAERIEGERSTLLEMDRESSRRSESRNVADAYRSRLSDDARFLRPGALPIIGKSAIVAALAERKEKWTWQPEHADVSLGADLGYTYGKMSVGGSKTLYYTRIWKRNAEGAWKLVLDVANAVSGQ